MLYAPSPGPEIIGGTASGGVTVAADSLFGNAGTVAAAGGNIAIGSGLALSGAGTLSATGATVPKQIQTAFARTPDATTTTITVTLPSAPTTGNLILFILTSYQGTFTPPAGVYAIFLDNGSTVTNEFVGVYCATANSGTTSYTFTEVTANGAITVMAVEISGANFVTVKNNSLSLSGDTVSGFLMGSPTALNYILFEMDAGPATLSSTTAGLTVLSYQSSGTGGHSALFVTLTTGYSLTDQSATFTTAPNAYNICSQVYVTS